MRFLLATLTTIVLAGCSGQMSTSGPNQPANERVVYPITAEEADRVLAHAMVATFPGTPISAVSLPHKGYTATIRALLDSHQITATAVPSVGVATAGDKVSGFAFEVMHSGTMPITASNRSASLFAAINKEAAAIRAPLPVRSN